MSLIFNNSVVNSNQTIILTKNNQTYTIVCASINSNPDVSLSLFDANSLISLSTASNSILQNVCNSSLCTNILQVSFQLTDNAFDNLTSLTCSANSKNSTVPLYTSISRNVSVIIPRK